MNIFRTGRHVGRTIYIQTNETAVDGHLIGVLDTRELAEFAVQAMNEAVAQGWPLPHVGDTLCT